MDKSGLPNSDSRPNDDSDVWRLLTEREREVLRLYLRTPNDKIIARLLKTTASTIRSHLSAIEKKAGVGSRGELLALFIPYAGDKST